MTRGASAGLIAELESTVVRPVILTEIGFTDEVLRLCSLNRDLSWDSQTWLGNGWLMPLRQLRDGGEIRSEGVEIELVGVSQTLLSIALANLDQGLDVKIYLGALDSSLTLVSSPLQIFKGKTDTVMIRDSLESPTVIIQAENDLARLFKPSNFRYTDQNQKALWPGDKGFEYIARLEDWNGFWGKAERPSWLKRKRVRQR